MPAEPRVPPRWLALSAWALALLAGCGAPPSTPSPPAPTRTADCQRYDDPDVHDHCLTHLVARGMAPPTACEGVLGDPQDCRSAGVGHALSQRTGTRGDLLAACGDAADCALQVLDARPLPDPVAQLRDCRAHTGPYAVDCTVHALQRWADGGPDATSFAAVAAETDHGDAVGALLGLVVACQQVGACAQASPAARPACDRAVTEDVPARPEICPLVVAPDPR